ncbi:MAG: ABC transporter permease [Lachnospiraceae bacterium]|nr:ABC transporter permease [Lachnospiraceae bacterium]
MRKILRKRIPREIRENFFRYLALFVMIVFCMYIIIALVDAAETIMQGTANNQRLTHAEDLQITVFNRLTASQISEIEERGVTVEAHFSFDESLPDGSVLRIFENREKIDTLMLESGREASEDNEIVIEKRYAEVHDLHDGSVIEIAGNEYIVTGIATSVDYDAPFRKFSDTAIDSAAFGTAFVTAEGYTGIRNSESTVTEDLTYAFILNGSMTSDELKEMIRDFPFDYSEVDDPYYQEMLADSYGKKDEILDGINELFDGVSELLDGSEELRDGAGELRDGLRELQEGTGEFANGIDSISGRISPYAGMVPALGAAVEGAREGAGEINDGAREAYEGSCELYDGTKELYDGVSELYDGVSELRDESNELIDRFFTQGPDNITSFVLREENVRIGGAAGDVVINKLAGMVAGVILIIMFTYVLSVFVIHQIQKESSVIGALYALGVKKKDLLRHYITLPTIVCFLGGITGALLGFSKYGCEWQMADSYAYYSLPSIEKVIPAYLIIYSIVMPPVVSVIVNAIVINKRLSKTALSLIRNEQKIGKTGNVDLGKMKYLNRFRVRQMLKEKRTAFTVVFGMFICLVILMLGLDCYVLCDSIGELNSSDTHYEYMYTYKYPSDEVPEGGEPCFITSLKKEKNGYSLDITVIGIDEDNPYYDVETVSGKNMIIASEGILTRYGVGVGDKIIFSDNAEGIDYGFTIAGTTPYSVGLSVFMDIDSMRELFGEDDDYYNVVLADHELDIEEGRLYSITRKEDIEKASDIFVDLMAPMFIMMISASSIIFCIVMYLMMSVMIDRAAFGISLVKIFGYRKRELKKLYLDGNLLVVVIGAVIGIPLSKMLMDAIFPTFVGNVACPVPLGFEWYYYLIIFAGIMLCYELINLLLTRKLDRIIPAEVLKNRE